MNGMIINTLLGGRLRAVLPTGIAIADTLITLIGQPPSYWTERLTSEANPLVDMLLHLGPGMYIAVSLVYVLVVLLVCRSYKRLARLIAISHAYGVTLWLLPVLDWTILALSALALGLIIWTLWPTRTTEATR